MISCRIDRVLPDCCDHAVVAKPTASTIAKLAGNSNLRTSRLPDVMTLTSGPIGAGVAVNTNLVSRIVSSFESMGKLINFQNNFILARTPNHDPSH
jgi:hypothetical protein